jgi:hypothetical protein
MNMRKASTIGLVGLLTVVMLGGTARAQEPAPVATAAPAPEPVRKWQVNLSFLPMSLGTFTASYGGMRLPADAAFAPGFGASVGYQVIAKHLSVGLAVQRIANVGVKEDPSGAGNLAVMSAELDLMARIVASLPIVETITLYAEVLPGYSLIMPEAGNTAKGAVIAYGGGAMMDLGSRMFVNVGVGYQEGFQKRTDTNTRMDGTKTTVTTDVKTEYWRIALGLGVKF